MVLRIWVPARGPASDQQKYKNSNRNCWKTLLTGNNKVTTTAAVLHTYTYINQCISCITISIGTRWFCLSGIAQTLVFTAWGFVNNLNTPKGITPIKRLKNTALHRYLEGTSNWKKMHVLQRRIILRRLFTLFQDWALENTCSYFSNSAWYICRICASLVL